MQPVLELCMHDSTLCENAGSHRRTHTIFVLLHLRTCPCSVYYVLYVPVPLYFVVVSSVLIWPDM